MAYSSQYHHKTRRLTADQMALILDTKRNGIDRRSQGGRRNWAMIQMLAFTGMRCSEVAALRFENVTSFEGNLVIRFNGKGNRTRQITLGSDRRGILEPFLKRHPSRKRPADPVFYACDRHGQAITDKAMTRHAIGHVTRAVGERVGIDNLHPHRLRHSVISKLAEEGADLHRLMKFAGHSSAATTMRYIDLSTKAQAETTSMVCW